MCVRVYTCILYYKSANIQNILPMLQLTAKVNLPYICKAVPFSTVPYLSGEKSKGATRINRCFPDLSRRAVDDLVSNGRVLVNGVPASLGQRLLVGDSLFVDGEQVSWEAHVNRASSEHVYIKCWKPPGITCTANSSDPDNILSHFKFDALPLRVFTVGRLDKGSSGLILVTSDGDMMNKLLGKQHAQIEKKYVVSTAEIISKTVIQAIREGVVIDLPIQTQGSPTTAAGVDEYYEYKTLPCRVKRLMRSQSIVEITLVEGKNRQIRKIFEKFGLTIEHLHRIGFASITLDSLRESTWAYLSPHEIKQLRYLTLLQPSD